MRERRKKMTKVEAYKAVISGEITEDVKEKFVEMLAAHEAEGEKRRNRAAEKRAEKLASEKVLDEIPEVDVKLLKLAQIMNGKVVTNDFNLNKVAAIKGIPVLNINELANTLKPIVLPGEEMILSLVKEGKENGQAVAYLDDGTMIVVEEGKPFIGQTIKVIVSSVLQTSAGRMIFAKPAGNVRPAHL